MKAIDLRQKQINKLRDYSNAASSASYTAAYAASAAYTSSASYTAAYATAAYAASAAYTSSASYTAAYATAAYAASAASSAAEAAPTYAEEVKAKVERNYCLIEIMLNIRGWFLDL